VTRYHQSLGGSNLGKPQKLLVIEDLRVSKQGTGVDIAATVAEPTSYSSMRELGKWCERLDEFGALVWMAVMLERR
jgi:hypothetical protein